MGCTASKLDNDDTVRLCKERRRLMKEAVYACHHLATAHANYCRTLRITGSALCDFAAGEQLSVSDQTPAVFLRPPNPSPPPSSTTKTTTTNQMPPRAKPSPIPSPSPSPSLHPTPPPPFSRSPKVIAPPKRRRKPPPKLPHILSDSSLASTPRSQMSNNFYPTAYQTNSTYSRTPSQASSVWNWENFYPPSPPDSEFFNQKAQQQHHHLEPDPESATEPETETGRSEYDFFQPQQKEKERETRPFPNHYNSSVVDEETEREEVQCSEWGDRYSTTTSSDDDEEMDKESRSEMGARSDFGSSVRQQPTKKFDDAASFRNKEISDMELVVRHKDLKEIVEALKENFDKAASAGDQLAEILEISRAQLDRSFKQLKKTVYHSSSLFSNLSASWTSKPPLAVKYRLDVDTLHEPVGPKSLFSTLDRLMAWEKKLYGEVKAREGAKIEHDKKLSTLQSQEYKGEEESKLDKTKASITKLQSLISVASQGVNTTSSAIISLRDSDLVPRLVDLCHAFMYMWRAMHQYHECQNNIVQQVRGLMNQSAKGESTSDLHRQATRNLESAIIAWHSSFCHLIKFQHDFVHSLHGWFKLTLIPVDTDLNGKREPSGMYAFFDEWKLGLERVPDTVASEAIKSFINVVHVISVKQIEELKIKKRTETASKELEKKASALRKIERKFYHSYSMVGVGLPDSGPDHGHALDARDPLAEKKSVLAACQRRVEDEMLRHSKAVEVTRANTLNNLQTGLPGVFQALTSFSALFTEVFESICSRSYAI